MRKRGYDIMQVRNFLREISQEMRARQHVRDGLAESGDPQAAALQQAEKMITDAENEAKAIIEAAQHRVDSVTDAHEQADEIIRVAHEEAEVHADLAEANARKRSGEVLTETQARLDQLLAAERETLSRIQVVKDHVPVSSVVAIADERSDDTIEHGVDPEAAAFAGMLQAAVRADVQTR